MRMQIQYAAVWYKNQLHWGKQTKATHLYIVPCLQQNLLKEIHPWATSFFKEKGFKVFFQEAMVSVQPSSAEELPETAVKA